MAKRSAGKAHRFGGDWTETKLDVIEGYLRAYTTALQDKPSKQHPFRKAYIDAFAGTGYRDARDEAGAAKKGLLFPDLADAEPQGLLDGSARIALKVEPRFDRYLFIEQRAKRCADLEQLKTEFPDLANSIDIRQRDANEAIQEICGKNKNWKSSRAVLFLDPYGTQVEWDTIVAVAETEAIDTWILFPLGMGVNRMLKRSGDIPDSWRQRLDKLLGTTAWFDEFYKVVKTRTLFGEEESVKKATMETIGRYFLKRLGSVFFKVSDKPRVLCNSSNSPLYLLCFAAGNESGAPIAIKIANHLLTKEID